MSFLPNMQSQIHGVTVLDELRWRAWPGVIADVWQVECGPRAGGEYVSSAPRLFVLLDTSAKAQMELHFERFGAPATLLSAEKPMCFVPAGVPLWSTIKMPGYLKHLDLHFDMPALETRFPEGLARNGLQTTRKPFTDERLFALARLIAAECCEPADVHDLYGEGLITALLSVLVGGGHRQEGNQNNGLTQRQLRKVTEFMRANISRAVSLSELADLVDLSTSHFAQGFKNSTGLPPYRWHLKMRVDCVKELLLAQKGTSLTEAALVAGFSDQAHLTRMFRRFEGITPAAWLRAHRG